MSTHPFAPALERARTLRGLSATGGRVLVGNVMPLNRIIAVGLLTRNDLTLLGPTFDRAWPVEQTPCFSQLLEAIDDADRELIRERGLTMEASNSE